MNPKSKIGNFFKYSEINVHTPRSGFKYDRTIKGSMMMGRLVPIGAPIRVMPLIVLSYLKPERGV